MSYDLTPFLTTLAGSSSSIVAILGGFIASKLITINSEREAVTDKLRAIEKELLFKESEAKSRQEENNACDALCFIEDHIESLFERRLIDDVYDTSENYNISKIRLEPYWNRSINLFEEFCDSYSEPFNSDHLPKELGSKYSEDDFAYEILVKIIKHFEKRVKEEKRRQEMEARKNNPFLNAISIANPDYSFLTDSIITREPTTTWNYTQNEQEIAKLNTDIRYLEFQKKQLEEQRRILTKPKGMRTGLVIFALFSLVCIITPLAMSPRYVENLSDFWAIKIRVLLLFIAGLTAIFVYLVYLLRWNDSPPNNTIEDKGGTHVDI